MNNMKSGSEEYIRSMVRVAQLYYEDNLTQSQIANKMLLTRWKVGRLLADARDQGIVNIEIHHPAARIHDVEERLCRKFGLLAAIVVPRTTSRAEQLHNLAAATAQFVSDLRPRVRTVGLSWGRTLAAFAEHYPPNTGPPVNTVQINGAATPSYNPNSGQNAAGEVARRTGGTVTLLHAPAIVEIPEVRGFMLRESSVAYALNLASTADIIVFSVGLLRSDSVLVDAGYMTAGDLERLQRQGAVGDLLGRFIDTHGEEVDAGFAERTMGLSLSDLKSMQRSLLIANGVEKIEAIRAVVINNLCSMLATDAVTARTLLGDL